NIEFIAVAGHVEQVGPFLPDAADGKWLAEVEVALQISLDGFNDMDLTVVGRHVRPGADDHRPAQARPAELVLPVDLAGLGDQRHDRVARRRHDQEKLGRRWTGRQAQRQRGRVDPQARYPAYLSRALVEAIENAAYQGQHDALAGARIGGKTSDGRRHHQAGLARFRRQRAGAGRFIDIANPRSNRIFQLRDKPLRLGIVLETLALGQVTSLLDGVHAGLIL